MIRKVIHIILVVFLLTSSTGFTFYGHYCGGKLETITINSVPDSCCGTECNCCHNESVTVKIHDNFSTTAFHFSFQLFGAALPAVQLLFNEQFKAIPQLLSFANDLPPPLSGRSILTSICVFRN